MKFTKLAYPALLALTFGLIGGCGSDDDDATGKCAGVDCGPHGTCNGATGDCDCELGYAGTFCESCAAGFRPEGNVCVQDQCITDDNCSDAIGCNGVEKCVGGICRPGTPIDCGPNGTCLEPDGRCECAPGFHLGSTTCIPNDCNGNAECDDNLVCNGEERCVGATCEPGLPINCGNHGTCQEPDGICDCEEGYQLDDKNNVCLKDECTDDTECDDGIACNGEETCPAGSCVAGTEVTCQENATCQEPDGDCVCDDGFVDDEGTCVPELEVIGSYDDGTLGHEITQNEWTIDTSTVFAISQYDNDADFLVAQNDSANTENPDLWSRFDWTYDTGDLYYCHIVGDAADEATAAADETADPADLATGCAGDVWTKLNPI